MNVLLVTVDSLRADRVTGDVMPFARSFADDGLEFTECVANGPSTPASFPAIHASRHFGSIDGLGIPAEGGAITLAEHLRDNGYATAGFTDNHFASGSYHYDRGFGTMHDASGSMEAGKLKQFVQANLDQNGLLFRGIEWGYNRADALWTKARGATSEYERAASLNERALAWIDGQGDDEPWFVWLHYMDVHHPYEAPDDYQRRFLPEAVGPAECRRLARKGTHHPEDVSHEEWERIRGLYDAECAYADAQFESLVGDLRRRGLADDTVVVFTADHGELVGEHGHAGHPPEFWEGIVRVPFVLQGTDLRGRIDGQVRLLDVPPTVADALGQDAPRGWEGESALEVARGDVEAREYAFGDVGRQIDHDRSTVRRSDGWKLLRHAGDGELLFDVHATPAERSEDDRIDDELPVYDELSRRLDEYQRRMADSRRRDTAIDEDERMVDDHLRELGYRE